jgi:hypothetical protein
MTKESKVFVCGDSAQDLLDIYKPHKIGAKHHLDANISFMKHQLGSAWTLYKLLGNPDPTLLDLQIARTTGSDWVEKKGRLFLHKYRGTTVQAPIRLPKDQQNSQNGAAESIKNCGIIAICDLYDSDHTIYREVIKYNDAWKVIRTIFHKEKPSRLVAMLHTSKCSEKSIIILNARDLREAGFEIKRGLSWEQLVKQTVEVINSRDVLKKNRFIIVCFEHDGVLLLDRNKNEKTLFFYPNNIEGDYVKSEGGYPFGLLVTFQAAITITLKELCKNESSDISCIISQGIRIGLEAMRELIKLGFNASHEVPDSDLELYPYADITKFIMDRLQTNMFTSKEVNVTYIEKNPKWTIFRQVLLNSEAAITKKETFKKTHTINNDDMCDAVYDELFEDCIGDICKKIIKEGNTCLEGLDTVPIVKHGKLISMDRWEIENHRHLYNYCDEYIYQNKQEDIPSSICVFGPSGAGKSFTVKAMIEYITNQSDYVKFIEFNLSQMFPLDLPVAFNQIRDKNSKGKLPIVFWDEFDSNVNTAEFGWLQYFLAPMHDGIYYEKGNQHHVGRAIFIFAGSKDKDAESFGDKVDAAKKAPEQDNNANRAYAHKLAKLIDFDSRLDERVTIIGGRKQESGGDIMCNLRRAFLIRKELEDKYSTLKDEKDKEGKFDEPFTQEVFDIDDDVIKILLKDDTFSNGVRSLKKEISKYCKNLN